MEGYDARFNPPLEKRLECPICLLAQREPMQTPCGHRFCSVCILRALRETGPRCPVDNTKISHHQLFKDNFAKREVLSLNVHCSADERGCLWQGELRDFELHAKHCELVLIECPHTCGHSCQRRELSSHLLLCPNKPSQCLSCSIHIPKDRTGEHAPYCSKIFLPESVQSSLFKGNEVLKWCGHLKLKLNNQPIQVTGYLSVKAETEESFIFTGTWYSTLSIIPLNSAAAKIFWKMLHGPEVQPFFFNFTVLSSDARSNTFQKMLKKKMDNLHAAVGLRLKQMNRRDLTLIYFYWSEQKKRFMACVAELKSYLVRQIQSRLQLLQQSSRSRRGSELASSRPADLHPHRYPHIRPHPHPHPHAHVHPHLHPHPHPHHHLAHNPPHVHFPPHPSHPHAPPPPTANVRLVNVPPQNHSLPGANPAGNSPSILPNLLSWQMSQSLNTFPWRMQAAGVPFFTFPSTPPQYLPSSSYPYTFAPVPAAPFSISPMQPVNVPSTVPLPSYNGIAVATPAHVAPVEPGVGPHPPSFAVAAVQATRPVGEAELAGIAVTLNSALNPEPATVHMAANISVIPHHGPEAIVPAAVVPAAVNVTVAPPDRFQAAHHAPSIHPAFLTASDTARRVTFHQPTADRSRVISETLSLGRHSHESLSRPSASRLHHYALQLPTQPRRQGEFPLFQPASASIPGPSGHSRSLHNPSSPIDSESSDGESTPTHFAAFSPLSGSDSDTPNTPSIDSPGLPFSGGSSSVGSSDQEGGSSQSDNESGSDSPLQTLANAAAFLADSSLNSSSNGIPESPTPTANSARRDSVRFPVLVNLSDSDSVASPPSVIDLTRSPAAISSSPSHSGNSNSIGARSEMSARDYPTNAEATPLLIHVPVIHSTSEARNRHPATGPSRLQGVWVHQDLANTAEPQIQLFVSHPGRTQGPSAHNPAPSRPPNDPSSLGHRGVSIVNWPYQPMDGAREQPVIAAPGYPQSTLRQPPGNFWDTVMPTLDMTLQNSSGEPRISRS